jgi:hypothetical protein
MSCDKSVRVSTMDELRTRLSGKCVTGKVRDILNTNVRPQRAGVILYTVLDGIVYFGLGLDSKTHDITDFGGTVQYRADGNAINGALREFQEETLEIFEPFTVDNINNCSVIYDTVNLIIFIRVQIHPNLVSFAFHKRYKYVYDRDTYRPEVCDIVWLNLDEFQAAIKEAGVMFSRVRRFLNKAGDLTTIL